MSTYADVRRDWKTLFDIDPAYDMTGGYVDQEDLDRMLKTPTKVMAKHCMRSQIDYWFQVGPDDGTLQASKAKRDELINSNHDICRIAEKYGYS